MLNKTKKWDLFHKKRLKNIEYPKEISETLFSITLEANKRRRKN